MRGAGNNWPMFGEKKSQIGKQNYQIVPKIWHGGILT